jgi:hypothetical protein
MSLQVTINSISGQTPYDVFICQSSGVGCIYISRIENAPYSFNIPSPYDNESEYMLKLIDSNNCIISGVTSVI